MGYGYAKEWNSLKGRRNKWEKHADREMMLNSMPEYKVQTIAQNVATRPTLYFHTVTTPERLKTGVFTFVRAAQQVSFSGNVRSWTLSEVNKTNNRNSAKNSDSRPNSI